MEETKPEQAESVMWLHRSRVLVLRDGQSHVHWVGPDDTITIGRLAESTICVDHHTVSRRHAVLRGGDPPTIEDLGSANGVRIGGHPIPKRQPVALAPGSAVEIGPVVLVLQQAPGRAAPPRPVASSSESTAALLDRVAQSDLSVLLLGETGSGKNRAAQQIHERSPRAPRALVHVSCAALPETLLEAELFGYERGAFTGATSAKPGLFEAADGGTLFLDEVGEMPVSTQAKLLAVLESRSVLRLGSIKPRPIDVRIVAATNRTIEAMVAAGTFRQDLYFRLDGISVTLPPLRERVEEIVPLARSFLAESARRTGRPGLTLGVDAERALLAHAWPGNVRELRTVIERAAVLATSDRIAAADLRLPVAAVGSSSSNGLRSELEAVERQRIVDALDRCGGNQTQAAKLLGISRRALIHRLEHFALERPRKR